MEKVIYLEPDDEITSVIDKIRKVTQEKVILVVPKAATILQSVVNLKLLKKESQKLGKSISVVTSDDTGRNLAAQIGLTVYRDIAKRPVEEEVFTPEEAQESKAEEEKGELEKPIAESEEAEAPTAGVSAEAERSTSESTEAEPELEKKEFEPPSKTMKKPEEIKKPEIGKEETPKKTSPGYIDIRPSSVKFKPHKDETRAGIIKEKKAEPIKMMKAGSSKAKKIILAIVFSVLGLGILAGLAAYFYLPKAKVEIVLVADMISKEFELTAEKGASLDLEKSIVPADEFFVDKEAQKNFPATGIKNVGEKARGTITAINETGTDQPLIANTRFQTPNGLIFRSTSGVVVPKAYLNPLGDKVNGSVNVGVIADQIGESYNIGASSFTIPGLSSSLQSKIYGRSSAAMTGGVTKQIKIVSNEDVASAKAAILKEMTENASQELQGQIDGDSYIIPDNGAKETIIEETSVPQVGAEASEFTLSLKAKLNILAIKKSDFLEFLNQKLTQQIPADKEVMSDNLVDDSELGVINREESKELINIAVSTPMVAKMEKDVIKGNIKKRSPEEAKAYLESFEEIYEAKITLWPFFARRVPSSFSRTEIISTYHLEEGVETNET